MPELITVFHKAESDSTLARSNGRQRTWYCHAQNARSWSWAAKNALQKIEFHLVVLPRVGADSPAMGVLVYLWILTGAVCLLALRIEPSADSPSNRSPLLSSSSTASTSRR